MEHSGDKELNATEVQNYSEIVSFKHILFLGAVEVTIANMHKKERCCSEEVYVVGFVPSHLLPKKRPCALDPFIHPLVSDVEDIFINGKFEVFMLQFYRLVMTMAIESPKDLHLHFSYTATTSSQDA